MGDKALIFAKYITSEFLPALEEEARANPRALKAWVKALGAVSCPTQTVALRLFRTTETGCWLALTEAESSEAARRRQGWFTAFLAKLDQDRSAESKRLETLARRQAKALFGTLRKLDGRRAMALASSEAQLKAFPGVMPWMAARVPLNWPSLPSRTPQPAKRRGPYRTRKRPKEIKAFAVWLKTRAGTNAAPMNATQLCALVNAANAAAGGSFMFSPANVRAALRKQVAARR